MKKNYVVGALLGMVSLILFGLILIAMGRDTPTLQERENVRTTGAVLTAITMKNKRLLEDSAKLAKTRFDARQLTDEEYQGLEAVINMARAGDWAGAEKHGYEFRKKYPFIQDGQ